MEMKRTLHNFFSSNTGTHTNNDSISINQPKKARVDFNPDEIIIDPAKRIPIYKYDNEIRDQVRRSYLLKGPTQPKGHNFPRRMQQWSFQASWFETFDWREYSVEKDAAFCFYCFLFQKLERAQKFGNEVFIVTGFFNWKKALETFNKHVGGPNSYHNIAKGEYENFKDQNRSVQQKISNHVEASKIAYKNRLTSSLDCARYLIMQGEAFRGHDESSTSINKGNFMELVDWYKDKKEAVKKAYDQASSNCIMISPKIQKDLAKACAQEVTKAVMDELGDRNFSVLIDESRDVSIKEQMAVILRFVNNEGKVVERFLGMEHVINCASAALKKALFDLLEHQHLPICRLRGQGYDGASNMRGEFNGLQTQILDENPYAFYVHCFAHQLQLVVVTVASCSRAIADFVNYVPLIVNTVSASCKRKDALLAKQQDALREKLENGKVCTGTGWNLEMSLARPGDTRWGSHLKTFLRIYQMWEAVIEVLEIVSEDACQPSSYGGASSLIQKMESFEFVFILHLLIQLLAITNELSLALQRRDQDIVEAMDLLVDVKVRLQDMRDNGWEPLLQQDKTFCEGNEIHIPYMEDLIPVRGKSARRKHTITYLHYYHVEIFVAAIDAITSEMNRRFNEVSSELLICMACLDPKDSFSKFDVDKLVRLAEIYADDFTMADRLLLRNQLQTFFLNIRRSVDFHGCGDIGMLAQKMVETRKNFTFPLVYRLIELILILPVVTASVERVFSAMSIIKTDLRNRVSDEWFYDLMICYTEREIFRSIDDGTIIKRFQDMKSRRMQLPHTQTTQS